MNKSKLFAYAIGAWLVVEVIAFLLVVQFLGMIAAVALGVGTTALGLLDIRRLLTYLRGRLGRSSENSARVQRGRRRLAGLGRSPVDSAWFRLGPCRTGA